MDGDQKRKKWLIGQAQQSDRNLKLNNIQAVQTERERENRQEGQESQLDVTYRRRPRVVGVTEAVGEEEFEDRESWGEAEPKLMIEVGFGESVTDRSLFSSSLLLRETAPPHTHKHLIRSVCLEQLSETINDSW